MVYTRTCLPSPSNVKRLKQALFIVSYMWLFKFKLIKIKQDFKFSSSVHPCPITMWLAITWDSGDTDFHHCRKSYWAGLAGDLFSNMPSFFSSLLVIHHLEPKTLWYYKLSSQTERVLWGKDTPYFILYNCASFYLSYTLPFFKLQLS